MGLPSPSTRNHEQRAGTVLDRETLLDLEALKNVWAGLTQPEAELLGHARG
jgi:hypothetical protein